MYCLQLVVNQLAILKLAFYVCYPRDITKEHFACCFSLENNLMADLIFFRS